MLLFSFVLVHWSRVSVETPANKSPSVFTANLPWCNLDVVFQAGGSSSREKAETTIPLRYYTGQVERRGKEGL